jgi:hypothetical protein
MAGSGIAVNELVGGGYQAPDGAMSVDFFGGELTDPRSGSELGETARSTLEDVFRANFPNPTPTGESRDYDAGPLGGHVWCVTYDEVGGYACGWLDEWTVGYVFGLGGTEAGTAELLVAWRSDTEQTG